MHTIELALPTVPYDGSYPSEGFAVRACLKKCLADLRKLHPGNRIRLVGASALISLPTAFHSSSSLDENAVALSVILDCLCRVNAVHRQCGSRVVPLYQHPLHYDRTVVWDSSDRLRERGYGDCKSLACDRVAEYWAAGQDAQPEFRFLRPDQNPRGQFQYHILVNGPYGREDPSKAKGMELNENAYFQDQSSHGGELVRLPRLLRRAA